MKLTLVRTDYTPNSTVGELLVNDEFFCYVLEDMVRQPGVKVWGKTAIPSGAYQVVVTYSPKFKRLLPLLLNVPNYEGIRIHKGNDANDTEGCVLVGRTKGDNWVGESAKAFDALLPLIQEALAAKEVVTITVNDTYAEPATATAPAKTNPEAPRTRGKKL